MASSMVGILEKSLLIHAFSLLVKVPKFFFHDFFSFYFWFERSFFLRSSFREKELEVFLKLLIFFPI
jgi:hypothetical protein